MPDRLRLILGVKLRAARQAQGLGLKDVAKKAGLSVSYLSEIEQGKKYPKADKLVDLSVALRIPYDDLVSLRVDRGLGAVKDAIESPLLRSFPWALFGVEPEAVVGLLAGVPDRAEALVRAVGDLSRAYDARVEDVLLAAMRAYQQVYGNHFPELEAAAEAVREAHGLGTAPTAAALREVLERVHGVRVDPTRLAAHPELGDLRSALLPPPDDAPEGTGATLLVNGALLEEQLAFVYARELGALAIGAVDRPPTSPWLRVERFEEILDTFRASYVAGALLLPAAEIDAALVEMVEAQTWSADRLEALLARLGATPEMLLHRFTQRIPEALGLEEFFFLRFHHAAADDRLELTKSFNLSQVPVPHGVVPGEHTCRRWPSAQALRELDRRQARAAGRGETDDGPVVVAQRQFYAGGEGEGAEFFAVAVARPLALKPGTHSAVELGLRLTRATRRRIRFWDDPALPRVDVGLTCERCPVEGCRVRTAPPTALRAREAVGRREAALAALATDGLA